MHKTCYQNTFIPIAIIGVSSLFSNARNPQEFWANIIHKKDLITDIPDSHWLMSDYYDADLKKMDKTYCKRGAFLQEFQFDPLEFGIPPNVVPALDPSQLLTLLAAKQAFYDATGDRYRTANLTHVGVILGTCALQALQNAAARMQRPIWEKCLNEANLPRALINKICDNIAEHYTPWQENSFPGMLSNVVAGRIANRFNLGGTNCVVDAACAGSLAALSMAVSELQLGKVDMMLTGGFDTLNDIVTFMSFSKTQALSLSGDCRPFSDQADGTLLGEGVGMFVLKRLSDAEADGDSIYAVIRGIGSSSDGRSKSIYAPLAQGQKVAIERAYEQSGYLPATVELIEAHGTGTKAGDIAEFSGLRLAFKNAKDTRIQQCALGSVKSQIGHTKAASGSAGMFKAVMALHHKILPATIKITKPNPALDLEKSPFYLNTMNRPWIRDPQHPRRASVSSFGFGGSNYHVTLEEYTGKNKQKPKLRTSPTELIILSAPTSKELLNQCKQLLSDMPLDLFSIARSSQEAYLKNGLTRLCIVADTIDNLKNKLKQAISFIQIQPTQMFWLDQGIFYGHSETPGKVAFIFPDRDSAYLGMTEDVSMAFNFFVNKWDSVNSIKINDLAMSECVFPIPSFNKATLTQQEILIKKPLISNFATAIAELGYKTLLDQLNIHADCYIGSGIGELVALCAANAMEEEQLIHLFKTQDPGLMKNVFSIDKKKARLPDKEVYSNSLARQYSNVKQLKQINLETKSNLNELISLSYHEGVKTFIEVGPHNHVTKLIRTLYSIGKVNAIHLDRKGLHGLTMLWHALGKMIAIGMNPNFSVILQEYGTASELERSISEISAASIKINGAPFGKRYPKQEQIPKLKKKNSLATDFTSVKEFNFQEKNMSQNDNPYLIQMQQELQKQVIDSHNQFQKLMTESHTAFLQVINNLSQPASVSVSGSQPMSLRPMSSAKNTTESISPSVPYFSTTTAPAPSRPMSFVPTKPIESQVMQPSSNLHPPVSTPHPVKSSTQFPEMATKPVVAEPMMPSHSVSPSLVSVAEAHPVKANLDLESVLLEVVVDKTGYPASMLKMDMAIEADLGIDSIKRVEILSALSEKIPNLPELNTNDLGQLQTLGDIVKYMKDKISLQIPA